MRPQTVVERLDFVAKRIPGLKFTPPTQLKPGDDQGYGCFMSCDMYYIEIKVDQSHQSVKDVVISHGNNADGISCPILRKVLADQDFETFAKHLSGLHSIYQINTNDKKVKQRAYPALTTLETDLTILYDYSRRRISNCHELIHRTPLGIMEPRKGGLPVRLTYFTTPYDLVDTTLKGFINLTMNDIIDKNLGLSATIEIEGSSPHKLQNKSLISTSSSLPAIASFNAQNSEKLPAQFVLKLSQPFPILNTSINLIINDINEPATIKEYLTTITTNSKESLVSLIARQELDLNKGPFCRSVDALKGADSDSCDLRKHVYSIKLLDQYHTYHILDSYLERQDGVYVTKIPFTHPTSVPNILRVLRQQALFNFVIGSCIRRNKNNNSTLFDESVSKIASESNIFDIIPVNLNTICISFEHPSKESLATLEIDLKETSCQLYALDKESVCSNEFATNVLQKCWSIPITLRAVLKKCDERRLALLEDANKRRERELQELLTNNSAQQGLQYKPHLQYQETLLQSKFNSLNEKSNPRDLNSIAEFLSSKVASTSNASNQVNANTDSASNRSNLLERFSCKPKAKQNTATKNQTGNKILSLMLKRQNSTTSSVDDASLKATLTKKAKTKSLHGDTSAKTSGSSGVTTTKLISSEAAAAARFANKQAKQGVANQNVSLSLIRSPSKSQTSAISSSSNPSISVGVSLTSQNIGSSTKQFDSGALSSSNANPVNARVKSQPNGNNSLNKSRKSSIGAVLDRLVGGVTPEQNSLSQAGSSNDSNPETATKNPDSSKGSPLGAKSKSRTIPADQFAIKQGRLGSLKLTVTKTKPFTASSSSSTSASASTSTTTSSSSTPSTTGNNSSNNKSETNKILVLGSSTPNIKYTIPKISKTQQAAQSGSNPASNSTDNQNSTTSDSNSHGDDSSNPSSSANSSSTPSSTSNKRTTSTLFNRTTNSNRNLVSSSTHPLGRATPNAPANSLLGYGAQPQQPSGYSVQPQQSGAYGATPGNSGYVAPSVNPGYGSSSGISLGFGSSPIVPSGLLGASSGNPGFNVPTGMFTGYGASTQGGYVCSANRPSPGFASGSSSVIYGGSSSSSTVVPCQTSAITQGVSSSSDSSKDFEPTISTPSSPTECGHAEVVPPPPLIPIDSLDEPQATSPETDHPDDASDRLTIVDTNETMADSNSVAGTPKPSSVNSPLNAQDSNSGTPSSSSHNLDSVTESAGPSRSESLVMVQSPAASTTCEGSSAAPQPSNTLGDESSGLSRRPTQSSSALAPSDENIAPQSTIAATTGDVI